MKKILFALLTLILSINTYAQDYIVEPANNSVVEALTDIYITWESATSINVDPTLMVGGIKAYMIVGNEKIFATDIFCGPAFGNYIMLTMMNPTTDAGDYIIEIPDNMITVDEVSIPAFNLNYSIAGIPVSGATIEVTQDGNSLNTIELFVSPCENLAINEDESIEKPFIIHNIGFNSNIAAHYTITITGKNTATLTTDTPLTNGHYTLHIPKGTFLIDGLLNQLLVKDFETTAIHPAKQDKEVLNVYNLNGIQVIQDGTQEDVDRLQPGIYIVNGSKKFVGKQR